MSNWPPPEFSYNPARRRSDPQGYSYIPPAFRSPAYHPDAAMYEQLPRHHHHQYGASQGHAPVNHYYAQDAAGDASRLQHLHLPYPAPAMPPPPQHHWPPYAIAGPARGVPSAPVSGPRTMPPAPTHPHPQHAQPPPPHMAYYHPQPPPPPPEPGHGSHHHHMQHQHQHQHQRHHPPLPPRQQKPADSSSAHAPLPHSQQHHIDSRDGHPPPVNSGRLDDIQYALRILQQPVRARMSGFGNSDRRPVDPPPILELLTYGAHGPIRISDEDAATLVVHASLWSADGTEDRNVVVSPYYYVSRQEKGGQSPGGGSGDSDGPSVSGDEDGDSSVRDSSAVPALVPPGPRPPSTLPPTPRQLPSNSSSSTAARPGASGGGGYVIPKAASMTDGADADTDSASPTPSDSSKESRDMIQTLVGSVVSQCMPLQDMDGRAGLFAVFHDLSIRTPGQYRIRFSLLKLIIAPPQEPPITTPILASALSEPVAVFQPKRFPGLLATTPLSEHFASQGLPIHVRKFIKPKRGVKSREANDGTD
ncbi:velvet factor-domain-containing protein [Geranomyces variabilis]|nr:velvet factor-domain-containing protein [Geranomyces variabilis]KAJ3134563.1 hypothetical protein HDU90_004894 [Geranomyces variabilis]